MNIETHRIAKNLGWKVGKDYPIWGNNELYLNTIKSGYLQTDETPKEAYTRLSTKAAQLLNIKEKEKELEEKFFKIFWNGWLIPSTPVMVNFGTDKGLPISCFSGRIDDDMYEIGRKELEMRMLSKHGGGTAYDFSQIRPIGSPIKGGILGKSDGIIPFMKSYDSTIISSKQGQTRRGAVALYLNSKHEEYEEFLKIREPKGDINRQCHNVHQGSVIEDSFMKKVLEGDTKERELWLTTLKTRVKTGEPYLFFIDNANKNNPPNWKENDLKVWHSNLCSEIMLPTDGKHTLVCCLSSLNLSTYDEWKDENVAYYGTLFLDAVIQDFINRSKGIKGIKDARRFAKKSRALGLGTLGWHTYLQKKNLPFISIYSNGLTVKIFSQLQEECNTASKYMGERLGEPEWCKGTGNRNLTTMAIAPNRSSSKLAGGVSQSIEPIAANIYMDDDAKGMYIRKNLQLQELLKSKDMDNSDIWNQILEDKGSVAGIKGLTDEEKDIFKTFKEINQFELVKQAGIRQKYIDQGQSLNLAFQKDAPANFINKVHLEAWKQGLKALYYFRSESILRADTQKRDLYRECVLCEG